MCVCVCLCGSVHDYTLNFRKKKKKRKFLRKRNANETQMECCIDRWLMTRKIRNFSHSMETIIVSTPLTRVRALFYSFVAKRG